MSLKKQIAVSSMAALIIGFIIILSPTLLINQLGFQKSFQDESMGAPEAAQDNIMAQDKFATNRGSELLPFMFEINLESSTGFEEKYLSHNNFGTPVFIISKQKSAKIILTVSSLSVDYLQTSFKRIDGLPNGVIITPNEEFINLQPFEQDKMELEITVIPSADSMVLDKSIEGNYIQIVLSGNEYDIATGFWLKIM